MQKQAWFNYFVFKTHIINFNNDHRMLNFEETKTYFNKK